MVSFYGPVTNNIPEHNIFLSSYSIWLREHKFGVLTRKKTISYNRDHEKENMFCIGFGRRVVRKCKIIFDPIDLIVMIDYICLLVFSVFFNSYWNDSMFINCLRADQQSLDWKIFDTVLTRYFLAH